MLLIDGNNKIKITEGDTGTLKIVIPGYQLKSGDTVYLTVSKAILGEVRPTPGKEFQVKQTIFEPDGSAIITINPQDTKGKVGRHFYDIQVTRKEKDIHTVVPKNIFEIMEEITVE